MGKYYAASLIIMCLELFCLSELSINQEISMNLWSIWNIFKMLWQNWRSIFHLISTKLRNKNFIKIGIWSAYSIDI